jgi:hypothetical protein
MPMTRPRYSLPVFPLACFLLGWAMDGISIPKKAERWTRNTLLILGSLLAVGALMGAVWTARFWWQIPMALATLGLAAWGWHQRSRITGVLPLSLVGAGIIAIGMWSYFSVLLPIHVEKRGTFRRAAAMIDAQLPEDAVLSAFRPGFWTPFYYIRHPVRYVLRPQDFRKEAQVVLLRETDLPELAQVADWNQRRPERLIEVPARGKDEWRLYRLGAWAPSASSDTTR